MSDIRRLPAVDDRVETGPVQFGEDWPGFFIRGDNAFALRLALAQIMVNPNDPFARMQVHAFMEQLDDCNLNKNVVGRLKESD